MPVDHTPPWPSFPACPCGCGEEGLKLNRFGHLARVCSCASCRNRNNRAKGRRNQTMSHRALGGQGSHSPADEEATGAYEIRVQPEHKTGYRQHTVKFYDFVTNKWFERAMSQANRARRVGEGSMPAVMLDGRWLIVDCKRDREGAA